MMTFWGSTKNLNPLKHMLQQQFNDVGNKIEKLKTDICGILLIHFYICNFEIYLTNSKSCTMSVRENLLLKNGHQNQNGLIKTQLSKLSRCASCVARCIPQCNLSASRAPSTNSKIAEIVIW